MSAHDKPELPELSTEQIKAGWHSTFSTSNLFCPCDLRTFTKAVEWAEHALGKRYEALATHREQEAAALVAEMQEALKDAQVALTACAECLLDAGRRQTSNAVITSAVCLGAALTRADAWLEGRR